LKFSRLLWIIPLLALGIWAMLAEQVQAVPALQGTLPPTPIPGLPPSVIEPKTHFPGVIFGVIVIVIIIMIGVLLRPRK
jgi:hypothetical protein